MNKGICINTYIRIYIYIQPQNSQEFYLYFLGKMIKGATAYDDTWLHILTSFLHMYISDLYVLTYMNMYNITC
jgi:hypothetical protein